MTSIAANHAPESSLVRHEKRCARRSTPPSRRKSCLPCASSKSRCDQRRPICGRCRSRQLACDFDTTTTATISTPDTPDAYRPATLGAHDDLVGPSPETVVSEARRQILLGAGPPGCPSDSGAVSHHVSGFVVRVLRSWPRLMALCHTARLPPMIHRVQLETGVPVPLARCYAIVGMWHRRGDGAASVRDKAAEEVQCLLGRVSTYTLSLICSPRQPGTQKHTYTDRERESVCV